MADEVKTETTGMDAVLDLVKEIKTGMVTRDAVKEIAEEIVATKMVDLETRTTQFDADEKDTVIETKEGTPVLKTSFTPDEAKDLDYVFLYSLMLGKDAAAVSPWVAKTLGGVYGADFTKAQAVATHQSLIPTGLSSQLLSDVELELVVANKFRVIDMPTNPFELPLKTGRTTAYHIVTDGTNATESSATTGKTTLTLEKLAVYTQFTYELEADSIVPVLPMLRQDIVEVLARQLDDNILNGHDSAVTGQTLVYNTWDGLKTEATTQATVSSAVAGTFTVADIANMRVSLKSRGVRTDDLILFTGVDGYKDLYTTGEVITMDKLGPKATVLTGQIGAIYGVPIVVSEFSNTTSANQGDALGLARTRDIVMASRSAFVLGRPRNDGVLVEQDKNIVNQTVQLVSSIRRDFQKIFGDSTDPSVAQRYIK